MAVLAACGGRLRLPRACPHRDGRQRGCGPGEAHFRLGRATGAGVWPACRPRRMAAGARPRVPQVAPTPLRSEEHTSELQSRENLVCRLLLEKKKETRRA